MSITSQQLYVLSKLAKVNNETDEFAYLTNTEDLDDELSKAVNDLRTEERKLAIKEAAQLVMAQLSAAKESIDRQRKYLAAIRLNEKQAIANIEYTAVAMEYGRETQNFLPLVYFLEKDRVGCGLPQEQRVPEADFKRLLETVRAKQKVKQQQQQTAKATKPAAKAPKA